MYTVTPIVTVIHSDIIHRPTLTVTLTVIQYTFTSIIIVIHSDIVHITQSYKYSNTHTLSHQYIVLVTSKLHSHTVTPVHSNK